MISAVTEGTSNQPLPAWQSDNSDVLTNAGFAYILMTRHTGLRVHTAYEICHSFDCLMWHSQHQSFNLLCNENLACFDSIRNIPFKGKTLTTLLKELAFVQYFWNSMSLRSSKTQSTVNSLGFYPRSLWVICTPHKELEHLNDQANSYLQVGNSDF